MKGLCPNCEKETSLTLKKENEIYKIKDQKISVEAEFYICSECGEDFATADQMQAALVEGYNKYRKLEGIIFPEEIIDIRKKYNASQKAFAKILNMGELTINSYEQGSLVAKSMSDFIKLMEHPENFTELFEKNKSKLTPNQIKKIEAALLEQKVHICYKDLDKVVEVKEKYTGYNRPDWEKYFYMLQMILYYAGIELYKTAMIKIAFYVDFTCYKKNLRSVTGWPYVAINLGPVPDEWKTILHQAEDCGYLINRSDDDERGELFSIPKGIDINKIKSAFSKSELEIIKKVTLVLKNKTAAELKDLTHLEDAWKKTAHASRIDYKYAETLKLF